MPNAPRLSIVTPMYNSAKFLAPTIESLLAQTMGDFELILSDDGSTDDTLKVAREFAARDPRVKIVTNPHKGIVATRNSGLKAMDASSEFITLFDSDDLWEKDAAMKLVAAMDSNPQAPAAHGLCRCVDMNGIQFPNDDKAEQIRNRKAVANGRIAPISPTGSTPFNALLIENYVTTPGTSIIRRSALEAVGGFDPVTEPCDDWDMNLRLARLGDLVFIDEILLSWRRHSMAISYLSTRWRRAHLATRYKTIHAQENTPDQRAAAKTALRMEITGLRKDTFRRIVQGELKVVPKKVANLALLVSVYVGVYRVG
jgi:glycosyltransferase involved in cell wall biosynthesis